MQQTRSNNHYLAVSSISRVIFLRNPTREVCECSPVSSTCYRQGRRNVARTGDPGGGGGGDESP